MVKTIDSGAVKKMTFVAASWSDASEAVIMGKREYFLEMLRENLEACGVKEPHMERWSIMDQGRSGRQIMASILERARQSDTTGRWK